MRVHSHCPDSSYAPLTMRRIVLLLAVAALLGATVATVDAAGAKNHGVRARAMKLRLKPFASCTKLVKYARHHAPREIRYAGGPVVAPASPPSFAQTDDTAGPSQGEGTPTEAPTPSTPPTDDTSGTNVQEQGVDEPDIVKTDGKTIFAIAGGRLNAIDARAATPKLIGSLELGFYSGDMLLHAGRLLVVSYASSPVEIYAPQPARAAQAHNDPAIAPGGSPIPYRPATQITEIDVS